MAFNDEGDPLHVDVHGFPFLHLTYEHKHTYISQDYDIYVLIPHFIYIHYDVCLMLSAI